MPAVLLIPVRAKSTPCSFLYNACLLCSIFVSFRYIHWMDSLSAKALKTLIGYWVGGVDQHFHYTYTQQKGKEKLPEIEKGCVQLTMNSFPFLHRRR